MLGFAHEVICFCPYGKWTLCSGPPFWAKGPRVLVLGGVHGDEIEGVALAGELFGHLYGQALPHAIQMMLVPCLNRDGFLAQTRQNAAGVDLNRNLPTKDWTSQAASSRYYPGEAPNSEPENQALSLAIETFRPVSSSPFTPLSGG